MNEAHKAALRSEHWARLRAIVSRRSNWGCETCGVSAENVDFRLEMHHLHYRTLGRERPDDVMLLCRRCHRAAHTQAAAQEAEPWVPISSVIEAALK